MVHQGLFWIGTASTVFLAVTAHMPGERKKSFLILPATFLMAAAVAKYLGM
jgi:hypothetical protein